MAKSESLLFVDDESLIQDRINFLVNMIPEALAEDSIVIDTVSTKKIAKKFLVDYNYSGLITDLYLKENCRKSETGLELALMAKKMGLETIVYSSTKNQELHRDMIGNEGLHNLEFRRRVEDDPFYLKLISDILIRKKDREIEDFIMSTLLLLNKKDIKALALPLSSISKEIPLVIEGPGGADKRYIAEQIALFLNCKPIYVSKNNKGDLTSRKRKIMIIEDLHLMTEIEMARVFEATQASCVLAVIYLCESIKDIKEFLGDFPTFELPPLYKRKREIALLCKRILGADVSSSFIGYIKRNKLNLGDLEDINKKNQEHKGKALVELHAMVMDDRLLKAEKDKIEILKKAKRVKSKKTLEKHNKIFRDILEGMAISEIAKKYEMTYQGVKKIKKEME